MEMFGLWALNMEYRIWNMENLIIVICLNFAF